MVDYFALGIVYAFAAAVQPGPLQTYLISQSLTNGWRRTVPAAFAPLLSDGPIVLLTVIVLTRVPGWFVLFLQCGGCLYLVYLAWTAWKSWRTYDARRAAPVNSSRQTLLKASFVNLLNPNPYLGWSLVMGPLLLKGWRETPSHGVALLIGFYGTIVSSSLAIIILFAGAGHLGPKINRSLIGISAVALGCFGLYQLWIVGASTWWK